jgi:hypothetical protein
MAADVPSRPDGKITGWRREVGSGTARWSEQIDVVVAGVRCTLDIEPAELVADLSRVLPGPVGPQVHAAGPELRLSVESAGSRHQDGGGAATYRLFDAGRPVTGACSAAHVVDALEHHVRIWVSAQAPDCLLVHAGVVVWDGRAIVLPGPSGSGKSTLVLALTDAGAEYASDDVAVVDSAGTVWPWPRPLRMRAAGGHGDVAPHPWPGPTPRKAARTGVPVGAIVVAPHRPDATWDVRPLGPALTTSHLLCNTPCARTRSAFALARCAALVRQAPGYAGVRGDAALAADRILDIAGRGNTASSTEASARRE